MTTWKEDIFTETTLLQAYRVSRKFKSNRFNDVTRWFVFAVGVFLAVAWLIESDWVDSHAALMKVSNLGFDLSVQILGFLIGGFAIFATVTDHRLMIPLQPQPEPRPGPHHQPV